MTTSQESKLSWKAWLAWLAGPSLFFLSLVVGVSWVKAQFGDDTDWKILTRKVDLVLSWETEEIRAARRHWHLLLRDYNLLNYEHIETWKLVSESGASPESNACHEFLRELRELSASVLEGAKESSELQELYEHKIRGAYIRTLEKLKVSLTPEHRERIDLDVKAWRELSLG